MMIDDYRFFVKATVLEKMSDPTFSGLAGSVLLYLWPKNYVFNEKIFDGKELLKEVRVLTRPYETASLFDKPKS